MADAAEHEAAHRPARFLAADWHLSHCPHQTGPSTSGAQDDATQHDQHRATERAAGAGGNLNLRVLTHLLNGT